jgi:hypothetical protein
MHAPTDSRRRAPRGRRRGAGAPKTMPARAPAAPGHVIYCREAVPSGAMPCCPMCPPRSCPSVAAACGNASRPLFALFGALKRAARNPFLTHHTMSATPLESAPIAASPCTAAPMSMACRVRALPAFMRGSGLAPHSSVCSPPGPAGQPPLPPWRLAPAAHLHTAYPPSSPCRQPNPLPPASARASMPPACPCQCRGVPPRRPHVPVTV